MPTPPSPAGKPTSASKPAQSDKTGGAPQDSQAPATAGSKGSESTKEKREQAAAELKKAGAQVASAGQQVANASQAQRQGTPGTEEPDPLIPESDATSPSKDLVFGDEAAAAGAADSDSEAGHEAASGDADSAQASNDANGNEQPGDAAETADEAEIADRIRAAEEALMAAGITLQEAGDAMASAESDEDLARVADLLSRARVTIIVASQDLMEARDVLGDEQAGVVDEAEQSLNDATVAIVIATNAVLGTPDFEDLNVATAGGNDKVGTLEDELEQSLIVFDGQIKDARQRVLAPDRNTGIPDGAILTTATATTATIEHENPGEGSGNAQGSVNQQQNARNDPDLIPEGVGNGQGDDIVAQQLREAAMAETDPRLKAKLWEEYKRYKSGR